MHPHIPVTLLTTRPHRRQMLAHSNFHLSLKYSPEMTSSPKHFNDHLKGVRVVVILCPSAITFELRVNGCQDDYVEEETCSCRALRACLRFPAVFLPHDFPGFFFYRAHPLTAYRKTSQPLLNLVNKKTVVYLIFCQTLSTCSPS